MGRGTVTPRALRTCYCGEVEDEAHFLLKCQIYFDIREKHKVTHHMTLSRILLTDVEEIYIRDETHV